MDLSQLFPGGGSGGDAQILTGSIGWEDQEDYVFDGGDDDDGHTLVRVQLFEGRDITKPINPKRAQGHKLVCHISSLNGRRVPPKDSRVFVAIPKGQENVPGAGVIFAAIEPQPNRAGNNRPDETVIVGPDGSAGRVVIKKNGTVALITGQGNDPTGSTIVLAVTPEGLKFSSPYGTISFDVTGFHCKTKAGPRIDMGGLAVPGLPAQITGAITGYCNITAPTIKANGSIIYLGMGPTYGTALVLPTQKMETPGSPVLTGPTPAGSQTNTVRITLP